MAGGEGVRLRPLTCKSPKPMVPVAGKPAIGHIVGLLKKHQITEIAITLKYMPWEITEYLGDGSEYGVHITYFTENEPLGTAGSVATCRGFIEEDFLVISGDCITDVDLSDVLNFHRRNKADATLVMTRAETPTEYGVVLAGDDGKIEGFLEKPSWGEVISDLVNTGIYILSPQIMKLCTGKGAEDFAKDIFPQVLKKNMRFFGYETDRYWCDIGEANAYLSANRAALRRETELELSVPELKQGIFVARDAVLEDHVKLLSPVYIGPGCFIGHDAVVGPDTVIGAGCCVEAHGQISDSILWDNCSIAKGSTVDRSILCAGVQLKESTISNGAVLGGHVTVGAYSYIARGVRIWPNVAISDEQTVTQSITESGETAPYRFLESWQEGWQFICGDPKSATLFGSAFGSALDSSGTVCVSGENEGMCDMILRGMEAGLMAVGLRVKRVEDCTLPVLRWMCRNGICDGAVYVRRGPGHETYAAVINSLGDEPDRKMRKTIRSKLKKEQFAYAGRDTIRPCEKVMNPEEFYLADLSKYFPEAYRCMQVDGRTFTHKEKEGITARMMAEFYPEAPLFISVASELPAREIAAANGMKVVKCGALPGDMMAAMEPYMGIPGVYEQYLMLFDEFAFQMAMCHFRAMRSGASVLTAENLARELPHIYNMERELRCENRRKASLIRYFSTLPELKGELEFSDGICFRKGDATVRICADENKPAFKISVESLQSEFAEEMTDRLEKLAESYLRGLE